MFYETVDEWQELDSQLTAQIADVLFTYHDKQFFTLVIPDVESPDHRHIPSGWQRWLPQQRCHATRCAPICAPLCSCLDKIPPVSRLRCFGCRPLPQ